MTEKQDALIHILLDRVINECEARTLAEQRVDAAEKRASEMAAESEKVQFERLQYQEAVDRAESLLCALKSVKLTTSARDAAEELHESVLACRNFENPF